MLDVEQAIDAIYEAAVVAPLWPRALDTLSNQFGGLGTVIFTTSGGASEWVSSLAIREDFIDLKNRGLVDGNLRLERATELGIASHPISDYELFDDAVRVVLETKRGSVSLLQRRLTIGYSRASRLIEQMAATGIVSSPSSRSSRW